MDSNSSGNEKKAETWSRMNVEQKLEALRHAVFTMARTVEFGGGDPQRTFAQMEFIDGIEKELGGPETWS